MSLPRALAASLAATALLFTADPAFAQRFTFDRTVKAGASATLDVTTIRGRIAITAGEGDNIVIRGTVTVRVGINAPINALELAKQAAARPSIETEGPTVRLRPPTDDETRRAVTVSYEIRVPDKAGVRITTDSGAVSVTGISGALSVTSTSGAIMLTRLGGETDVTTGSGAVAITGAAALKVRTQSSGIDLRELHGSLDAHTQSGRLSATFAGTGDVAVETGSSEIRLNGVHGGLTAQTGSGRVTITGTPTKPWTISTTSGAIRVGLSTAAVTVDATTSSGSVVAEGLRVTGTNEQRHIAGAVGSGGPLVRLTSRSGSITIGRVFE
jgi:DUF4097 and DUF4098 domain-containing protein YvlB